MSRHEHRDSETERGKQEMPEVSGGFERSDVRPKGIVGFLIVMGILAALSGVFCYQIGKVLFVRMTKEDGPKSKWSTTVDLRSLGNMPNDPDLRNKMETVIQQFPTPQLQTDDGSQEIADLHKKEDLILENYSWVDQERGKVRIPIERAMRMIAQSGLPVAPRNEEAPIMTGDSRTSVIEPLTNGFARTGYEQEEAQATAMANMNANSQK
jgi:hypothetical protein